MNLLPLAVSLAGAGLALAAGRRGQTLLALGGWAAGVALCLAGLGMEFHAQGLPDHAALAYAAALALLMGHAAGLGLLWLSPARPVASALGLAMALGLPPLGAFPGLWLGLQAIQAAQLLLPAWFALSVALAGLACLAGGLGAWQTGIRHLGAAAPPRRLGAARYALMALGIAAGFLPWLWVLPAQVVAARLTHELPMLLLAFGMILTPVIPGQASVIPFGLLAIAMALSSVLLLVLRLTRRAP